MKLQDSDLRKRIPVGLKIVLHVIPLLEIFEKPTPPFVVVYNSKNHHFGKNPGIGFPTTTVGETETMYEAAIRVLETEACLKGKYILKEHIFFQKTGYASKGNKESGNLLHVWLKAQINPKKGLYFPTSTHGKKNGVFERELSTIDDIIQKESNGKYFYKYKKYPSLNFYQSHVEALLVLLGAENFQEL